MKSRMRFKLNKISLYWKCQLTGWSIFIGVPLLIAVFLLLKRVHGLSFDWPLFRYFFFGFFILLFTGILISHFMRKLIKKFKILSKSIFKQIIYCLGLCIIATLLFDIVVGVNSQGLKFFKLIAQWWSHGTLGEHILIASIYFASFVIWYLIYIIYHYINKAKSEERKKMNLKIQFLELEAKALRAQMNPHFIFNCMNSIKSLIQQHEEEKSISYLTTFSKLIRTIFNNADKKEISLFDEIETCRYYLQLEAMRFDSKFSYQINIVDSVDLKSVFVPALIVQPFIENAIWHGIVPRNNGGKVILSVSKQQSGIEIIVDDDGIGREYSKQNKSVSALTHQSKGVNLTEARLHLNNLLQQRQAELEIIDKIDANGGATGTTVIIKIKDELL